MSVLLSSRPAAARRGPRIEGVLTPRQELILRKVVEGYLEAGLPVGSKSLAADVEWGPSTIRNELAMLEEHGLLAHPHTSAGRVPTDAGYRHFVDALLSERDRAPLAGPTPELSLTLVRRELDEAMRVTTETLSQVTNMLTVVSAPPLETATVRHIELLPLQPQVLMVVVITSTGGVTKRVFTFDAPVDPGLVDWASSFLNEQLVGMGLGARKLHQRLTDPSLGPRERGFVDAVAPVFTDLADEAEHTLYVDGAARLVSTYEFPDVAQLNDVMQMLERRVTLLSVLQAALSERDVYVRIGSENEAPALQSLALVAASYGLPRRSLGTVSVIGPLRMDYEHAIRSVRAAAHQLSRFVEEVYEE
jgi:heat-inducible transcriptional repressor